MKNKRKNYTPPRLSTVLTCILEFSDLHCSLTPPPRATVLMNTPLITGSTDSYSLMVQHFSETRLSRHCDPCHSCFGLLQSISFSLAFDHAVHCAQDISPPILSHLSTSSREHTSSFLVHRKCRCWSRKPVSSSLGGQQLLLLIGSGDTILLQDWSSSTSILGS